MNSIDIIFRSIIWDMAWLPLSLTILMVLIIIVLTIIWDIKELKKGSKR